MSAPDPFRISPWWALRAGWRDLWRWPALTALALLAATTSALALRATWVRAGQLLVAAGHGASPRLVGRALAVWLVGNAMAALLIDTTRAAALTAYAGPTPPDRRLSRLWRPLALGLQRTPGMISVRAVELLLYFSLALGDLFVCGRALAHAGRAPGPQALAVAAGLLPSLVLATVVFAASRVAWTLIARGMLPAVALAHGYDVVLRRFATLARLALAGLLVAGPAAALTLLLPLLLAAPLWALVALWLYAALASVVGRDGRLVGG